jgi:type VI secretion system secreted protein Hcp
VAATYVQKGAAVALNAYLKLVGQRTGEIRGSVTQKGREGKIMVIAATHDIVSPRDPASGLRSGPRMHKPFVITKEVDRASVPLHQLQMDNENLRAWELEFWTPQVRATTGTGAEVQYFTITLTNASVTEINLQMPNTRHPDLAKLDTFEEVAFNYETIQWTWKDGGITASDSWAQRSD